MLIVEDNEADVFLILRALEATKLPFFFHVASDGQQAIHFIDEVEDQPDQPMPEAVILDINLPRKQGGDVLKHVRQSRRCHNARVVVVSTSDSPQDRQQMAELGADAYFHKPSKFDEFMKLGGVLENILGGRSI